MANGGLLLKSNSIHYEGKTKCIYNTDVEDQVIIEFKDTDSKFDGEKKAKFKNKGILK
ncbi:MAG: hypothetical protein JW956_01475, partial [Calditrichaceae bacterium]|nr:hypothetical protein [Calditrichaceae bacterium]